MRYLGRTMLFTLSAVILLPFLSFAPLGNHGTVRIANAQDESSSGSIQIFPIDVNQTRRDNGWSDLITSFAVANHYDEWRVFQIYSEFIVPITSAESRPEGVRWDGRIDFTHYVLPPGFVVLNRETRYGDVRARIPQNMTDLEMTLPYLDMSAEIGTPFGYWSISREPNRVGLFSVTQNLYSIDEFDFPVFDPTLAPVHDMDETVELDTARLALTVNDVTTSLPTDDTPLGRLFVDVTIENTNRLQDAHWYLSLYGAGRSGVIRTGGPVSDTDPGCSDFGNLPTNLRIGPAQTVRCSLGFGFTAESEMTDAYIWFVVTSATGVNEADQRIVGYAAFSTVERVGLPSDPVVRIGNEFITISDFEQRIKLERALIIERLNVVYRDAQSRGEEQYFQNLLHQAGYLDWWDEIQSPEQLGARVLNDIVDEALIELLASELDVTVSEEDIQGQINQHLAYQSTSEASLNQADADFIGTSISAIASDAGNSDQEILEWFRMKALRKAIAEQVIGQQIPISDAEVRMRHILVDTQVEAQNVLTRLEEGESFSSLAQAISQDAGSAERGGEYDWNLASDYVHPLPMAILSAEIDGYIGPIQTVFGWHIIQVTERREIPLSEDAREKLLEEAFEEDPALRSGRHA